MPWDFALILIFLGVAVPLLGCRRVRQLLQIPATTKEDRLGLYASTMAFQWIASAIIFWRTSARGVTAPQLVGLRRLSAPSASAQGAVPQLARKLFPQDGIERLAFFALVVTVAVCEEFIYRGFVQHVFQSVAGGSLYFAVFGSAGFFALAHLYQGRRDLISTFIIGVLFAVSTVLCLSLIPAMAAHFVADFTAGMLASRFLKNAGDSVESNVSDPRTATEVESTLILCA